MRQGNHYEASRKVCGIGFGLLISSFCLVLAEVLATG